MAKTRAQLKSELDAFLVDNWTTITASQLNAWLQDALDAFFCQKDDYAYPASVETIDISSPTLGVTVDGTKVIGARETGLLLAEERDALGDVIAKLNALITALENHGLISTIPPP